MTKRLATMCLVTILLVGAVSRPARAQDPVQQAATLKGISAVYVSVEGFADGDNKLGLTKGDIQTDVELKLRLTGMRVVTKDDWGTIPGAPQLRITVTLPPNATGVMIGVDFKQYARLSRNDEIAPGVTTWDTDTLAMAPRAGPTAQGIRNIIKENVDQFLNAWLSVNPKK